jgi:hypothetical protein
MTIEPVTRALDAAAVPWALIGAHAMAARGYPRFTVDVDLLTTDLRVLDAATWAALVGSGARVDRRRGDEDDPLAGVIRVVLADETNVDVVVGRWEWERQVVARAEPMTVLGVTIAVATTSDLILLKLAAGGHLDLHDAAALLALGNRDRVIADIEARLDGVRPDVRRLWRDLLSR